MIAMDIARTDPNHIGDYVELISADLVKPCEESLRKVLESVDFMPVWAIHFLIPPYSDEVLWETKEYFRPRYRQLVDCLCKRAERL